MPVFEGLIIFGETLLVLRWEERNKSRKLRWTGYCKACGHKQNAWKNDVEL